MDKTFTISGDQISVYATYGPGDTVLVLGIDLDKGDISLANIIIKFEHMQAASIVILSINLLINDLREEGKLAIPNLAAAMIWEGFVETKPDT